MTASETASARSRKAEKSTGTAAVTKPAARSLGASGKHNQAKHQQAAQMVRDLQSRAEVLLANADRLLDRLS